MLGLDRIFGMHFFTNDAGGNMMNYINLFWIWGHPEVYILVLPAFGIYSEVVATFSSKRLFGYTSVVYATAVIALLSFTVWLHHFFTMGSSADVNAFFGIATMIIAVPTGVKIFDWLFTMYRGRIRFHPSMLWTIGFIVTFVIGGMTGVLLAMPPADFMMHNSTFLVAHFHNMIIPGVLFGYLAGYMYWFPKAFGFALDEVWGRRAFWLWAVGFYLAFMPLYVLGFLGMPRRMEQYSTAEWQPYLIVAALGAFIILLGIVALVIQLLVSIRQWRDTRDLSGDPWDGRTLEWLTSSPPAPYNFAVVPDVRALDAFHDLKKRGVAYSRPTCYEDIYIPKNSGVGPILGGFAFLLGFAMVWHIWWLAAFSGLVMLGTVALRTFADDTDFCLTAAEVEAIEDRRYEALAQASHPETAGKDPTFSAQMLPGRLS
jgi:cytochrome o ubiquinol oxidase subunit 1